MRPNRANQTRGFVALVLALLAVASASAATFTVINTADSGAGSLRQAILDANGNAGADRIEFNIPGVGVQTVAPLSVLPTISQPVDIDGYSQPGAAPNTLAVGTNAVLLIELAGNGSTGFNGITLASGAGASTIRGLVVNRFNLGIVLNSASNVVSGNFIGVDPSGTLDRGNQYGLSITGTDNLIGGSLPGQRNVISANLQDGVSTNAHRTTIQGNYIGTNAAGTAALGNRIGIDNHAEFAGVSSVIGGLNGTPGGSCTGACNLISGNGLYGILLDAFLGNQSSDIRGNYLGTDVTGQTAIPNREGIFLGNSTSNHIGSATGSAAERNLISGNAGRGIAFVPTLSNSSRALNSVHRNYIGLSSSGGPLGNGGNGIELTRTIQSTIVENSIGYNAGQGLRINIGSTSPTDDSLHDRNRISRNAIFANGAPWMASKVSPLLGIDLAGPVAGVTVNDAGDGDHGPNHLQNFPVLTAATSSGGGTEVQGTLNSAAGTSFVIDLFRNDACDLSGFGEGQEFLGDTTVISNGSGDAAFDVILPAVASGSVITATATDPDGNTSEFSACRTVAP